MRRSTDQTVTALRKSDALRPTDAGLVGLLRTLADTIDAEVLELAPNRYTIGILTTWYTAVEERLCGPRHTDVASDIGYDAELEQIKAALRDAERP